MRTKNKLASLLALLALCASAHAAITITADSRTRAGSVTLPSGLPVGYAPTFSAAGTQACRYDTTAYAFNWSVAINPVSDNGDGTYKFTVTTCSATSTTAGATISGTPTVTVDGATYAQGAYIFVRYQQPVSVTALSVPTAIGGAPAAVVIDFVNQKFAAPGFAFWDSPGVYVQNVIAGYGYGGSAITDLSYYVAPTAFSGLVAFQVVEWRGLCTGLNPGRTYIATFYFERRRQGSGAAWATTDPQAVSFVAGSSNDQTPYIGGAMPFPHVGTYEYRLSTTLPPTIALAP